MEAQHSFSWLDERKRSILQAVIEDFISTGEPVGSRTVARKYELGVSPATIRNEMADLEELGYLEQPHTSAGRLPSDLGYRYYVDYLMEHPRLSNDDIWRIRQIYDRCTRGIETLVQITTQVLAEVTDYLALVLAPSLLSTAVRAIQIIPLSPGQALLLVVTENGIVESRVLQVPPDLDESELARISYVWQKHLRGLSLDQISSAVLRMLASEMSGYRALLDQIMELLEQALSPSDEERVFLAGATNIMRQPEFRDVEKLRMLLSALEQREMVCTLLAGHGSQDQNMDVFIVIGGENRHPAVRDCSLVVAPYRVGEAEAGRVGLLGPRRMEYGRAVSVTEYVTTHLAETLTRFWK
ncbi:MAG TPA: heat-inducible transcription repressor HrcA [Firmicutes bacterium]|jgi:heat-inducible transcriptional repressor|nr:heat-inducible transcription repressor HrcA [Bacillota bacterium]